MPSITANSCQRVRQARESWHTEHETETQVIAFLNEFLSRFIVAFFSFLRQNIDVSCKILKLNVLWINPGKTDIVIISQTVCIAFRTCIVFISSVWFFKLSSRSPLQILAFKDRFDDYLLADDFLYCSDCRRISSFLQRFTSILITLGHNSPNYQLFLVCLSLTSKCDIFLGQTFLRWNENSIPNLLDDIPVFDLIFVFLLSFRFCIHQMWVFPHIAHQHEFSVMGDQYSPLDS